MSYIGKTPVIGNFVKLDAISVVNNQAAYTMQNGGANFTEYSNVNQFLVSLNGILQSPTTSFTVSGSTITFASNLVTGDVIDHIIVLGNTLDVGVPSDNTVSLAKLTATGTKDATTFLRGDNSFQEVPAGGITEVDMWRITANASIGSGAVRYGLTSNWERADTYSFAKIGDGMTESSGIFSFTNTGIYYVEFSAMAYIVSSTMRAVNVDLIYTADNSNYVTVCNQEFNVHNTAGNSTHGCATARYIFDITDVSNQKLKFGVWDQSGAAGTVQGNTDTNFTFVTFMKLGDT